MSRWLILAVATVAVYLTVLVSLDPWDIAIGSLLTLGLLVGGRKMIEVQPAPDGPSFGRRAVAFVPFVGAVIRDIVVGTWQVALITLGLRSLVSPGIVKVPIGRRSPSGVAVSALMLTLSPGEFLVDVDWDEGVMLIHAIDASDPSLIRRHHERFYERYQRPLFP